MKKISYLYRFSFIIILYSLNTTIYSSENKAFPIQSIPLELRQYIAEYAGLNAINKKYDIWLPLQKAASSGNFQDVQTLVMCGANINSITNLDPESPLMKAISFYAENQGEKLNKAYIFHYLLKHGANINQSNHLKQSVLHIATTRTDFFALFRLLKHRANLNQQDYWSQTPLDQVRTQANSPINPEYRKRYYEICRILQAAGADSTISLNLMPSDETMEKELKAKMRKYNTERMLMHSGPNNEPVF